MRKLLNKPWFVAVLVAVAVGAGWLSWPRDAGGRVPAAVIPTPEDASDPGDSGGEESDPSLAGRSLRAALAALILPADIRNPFAERTSAATAESASPPAPVIPDELETVRLSAVWSQGDGLYVVLNDSILQVGDRIGRLTIESAGLDGVWLTHWKGRDFLPLGKTFTLATPVHPTPVSTPATNEG